MNPQQPAAIQAALIEPAWAIGTCSIGEAQLPYIQIAGQFIIFSPEKFEQIATAMQQQLLLSRGGKHDA